MKKTLITLAVCAAVTGGGVVAAAPASAASPTGDTVLASSAGLAAPTVLGSLDSGSSVRITGTGVPGATVAIDYAGWDLSARVMPNGTWITTLGLFEDDRTVTVSQSLRGQQSPSTVYVIPSR